VRRHVLLGLSNVLPGRESDFIRWIDSHHIPEVLRVPGVVSARRFELSNDQLRDGEKPYRYATIYEIETDDLKATFQALRAATQAGTQTDTRDPRQIALWSFTQVGPVRVADDKEPS
jgi:hypothetical protein